jgi:TRAP-type C4-dicarboxylate transport system permease small subunit
MTTDNPTAFEQLQGWVERLAGLLAAFGGVCLIAACGLTGASILFGLVIRPIPGEIEVVEALCGLAIFAFLPFCQLRRGHVGVDLIISAFGPKAMNWTQMIGDVIIAVLFVVLTWRHGIGLMDKYGNGETTPLLLLPLWWGYAVAMFLMVINVIVCLFVILADVREIRRGNAIVASVGVH